MRLIQTFKILFFHDRVIRAGEREARENIIISDCRLFLHKIDCTGVRFINNYFMFFRSFVTNGMNFFNNAVGKWERDF